MFKSDNYIDVVNGGPKIKTKDPIKNIKYLYKIFHNKTFMITDKTHNISLPAKIILKKNGKDTLYSIIYSGIKYQELWPFKIDFFNMTTLKVDGTCYIANIHRTIKLTGTTIMETIMKLLQLLRVKKVTLHDGTTVRCAENGNNMDLSYFKILEKGITFYQKFGFEFEFDPGTYQGHLFLNKDNMMNIFKDSLNKFNKMKTEYIKNGFQEMFKILTQVVLNQDFDLEIEVYDISGNFHIADKDKKRKVSSLMNNMVMILEIFNDNKKFILFKDLLIHLFYNDCVNYSNVRDVLLGDKIYKIKYKGANCVFKHIKVFDDLDHIRHCYVSRTFTY